MTTIKIDNKEYDVESLSEEAKAQLASIRFVDAEIERLQGQLAVMQTARMSYAKALQNSLPLLVNGDTIKFS